MRCHKILVVEDDDKIRALVIELLASEGYEAVPAHHGREALDLMKDRSENPCLIISDLMMPEMDGLSLIRYLKAQDILITIPVIIMTASHDNHVPGAQKVIKKPFDLDTIVSVVKEHCGEPNDGPITVSHQLL